jgi:hypothetical protein
VPLPLDPTAAFQPDLDAVRGERPALTVLNYPANPCAACVRDGTFPAAVDYVAERGGWLLHDLAYDRLTFDGREARSVLATPGAREVAVELWSPSKVYGIAGWRIGFLVGNAELVGRVQELIDHATAGVWTGLQRRLEAALRGDQASVEERRRLYERRRDLIAGAVPGLEPSEGHVLRVVAAARRAHRRAAADRAPRRRRTGGGLRRARPRVGAALARDPRRGRRRGRAPAGLRRGQVTVRRAEARLGKRRALARVAVARDRRALQRHSVGGAVRPLVEVTLGRLDDRGDHAVHAVLPRDREEPADVAEQLARGVGEVAAVGRQALHAPLRRGEQVSLRLRRESGVDLRGKLAVQGSTEFQHGDPRHTVPGAGWIAITSVLSDESRRAARSTGP